MAEYRYCLRGEVDLADVAELRLDLGRAIATGSHLLIDCDGLTFIDSSVMTVLLEANNTLEALGRHMLMVNVRGAPRRTIDLLGVADLLRYDRAS